MPFYVLPNALVFQGILASALALTGTFDDLSNLYVFPGVDLLRGANRRLIALRIKEPNMSRVGLPSAAADFHSWRPRLNGEFVVATERVIACCSLSLFRRGRRLTKIVRACLRSADGDR